MVLYPGGSGPGFDETGLRPTPVFYIDDTTVEISERKHVILASIRFEDEGVAISATLRCKSELGISFKEELKWNAKGATREQAYSIRNAMLPVLARASGTVVIYEGTKAEAANAIAKQLSDYSRALGAPGFVCRFDRGIIGETRFAECAESLDPPCVGIAMIDSRSDPLLQAADLFAGFQKLRIDTGTGRVDAERLIRADVYDDETADYPLGWYLSVGLRYCLWGSCEGDKDQPTKINAGLGVRVYSSAPQEAISRALTYINSEYMGCIH